MLKINIFGIQWTLSISATLYLEHLSISSYFSGPLNISTKCTLIPSLYLENLCLELLSVSNKNFDSVATTRIFYKYRFFSTQPQNCLTISGIELQVL